MVWPEREDEGLSVRYLRHSMKRTRSSSRRLRCGHTVPRGTYFTEDVAIVEGEFTVIHVCIYCETGMEPGREEGGSARCYSGHDHDSGLDALRCNTTGRAELRAGPGTPHIHEVVRDGVIEGEINCTSADCKLEPPAEPQSRSRLKREAVQRGEPMPTFAEPPAEPERAKHYLAFDASHTVAFDDATCSCGKPWPCAEAEPPAPPRLSGQGEARVAGFCGKYGCDCMAEPSPTQERAREGAEAGRLVYDPRTVAEAMVTCLERHGSIHGGRPYQEALECVQRMLDGRAEVLRAERPEPSEPLAKTVARLADINTSLAEGLIERVGALEAALRESVGAFSELQSCTCDHADAICEQHETIRTARPVTEQPDVRALAERCEHKILAGADFACVKCISAALSAAESRAASAEEALRECLIQSPHSTNPPEGCLCRWCKARRLLESR